MSIPSIQLITISREFGAGGSEFASLLGARLGWAVLDQEIVHRVAAQLNIDDRTVEKFAEHTPSLLARIATVLVVPQPDMYSFPPAGDIPGHDTIAAATRAVIEKAAESTPIVIVGHGAQCIFAGREDALHIRLIAPLASRQARVVDRLNIDAAAAAALIPRADHDRQMFVQRYFHRDWRNELLYHLQINTGRISLAEGVEMIAPLVERRNASALQRELAHPV